MKVGELKELCRERSLNVTGKKDELVQRLAGHEAAMAVATSDDSSMPTEFTDEEAEALAEEALEYNRDSPKGHMKAVDKFIRAIERDEGYDLEEIFQIQRPQPGEVVRGQVSNVMDFGAFVELEDSGWTGLIHISEISGVYVENIEDYVRKGQTVECLVIKGGSDRIDRLALSLRRMTDPSDATNQIYSPELAASMGRAGGGGMNLMSRRDPVFEGVRRLEVRIGAIESVLLQLCHGPALRNAQEDARNGITMPVVPHMETLLSGIASGEEQVLRERRKNSEREKKNLNSILQEMLEGTGSGPKTPKRSPPPSGDDAADKKENDSRGGLMMESNDYYDPHEEDVREDGDGYVVGDL